MHKERVFNFSAGPAMLPTEVLEQAQAEILNWQGSGMSVMEMSHRGKEFIAIATAAEQNLRNLLTIPNNYKVLFVQGGASAQFAMVPVNLLRGKTRASYINTGIWSKKAIAEAARYCKVHIAGSTEDAGFDQIPPAVELDIASDSAYVHYTPNETIGGVEFDYIPDTGDIPLVADMSSSILSGPLDVSKFGVIYAGAQKNIGPAGLTIVIVREDLIGEPLANQPTMFDYKTYVDADSMYNTPPTYAWYLAGLVFKWLKDKGGLEAMARINQAKAEKLYTTIDSSNFYKNPVVLHNRSLMNVPFTLADNTKENYFLEEAKLNGLVTLKGHRSVGGMRASIYNAMPMAGVDALAEFMREFEKHV